MASVVGRSGRCCHRAFREVTAFEPAAQGSSHFQHRGCSFLRPPPREGGSYAPGLAATNAQLGAVPALYCLMLSALRKARRCWSTVEKLRQITPVLEHWRVREDREFFLDGLRLAIDQTARPA